MRRLRVPWPACPQALPVARLQGLGLRWTHRAQTHEHGMLGLVSVGALAVVAQHSCTVQGEEAPVPALQAAAVALEQVALQASCPWTGLPQQRPGTQAESACHRLAGAEQATASALGRHVLHAPCNRRPPDAEPRPRHPPGCSWPGPRGRRPVRGALGRLQQLTSPPCAASACQQGP